MKAVFEYAPQSDYMALKFVGRSYFSEKHQRGDVQSFSAKSRSRLSKKISQVRRHCLPLFVTLTYPDFFPVDFQTFKYHLHKFVIYLLREYPGAGLIWKLEFQKRGAPHFHMLLWNVSESDCKAFIPECWYKIAGDGDLRHLRVHTGQAGGDSRHCVEALRSWHGVKSYVAKYMSKLDVSTDKSGRFWGVRGSVPFSPFVGFSINMQSALDFRAAFIARNNLQLQQLGFWAASYDDEWLLYIWFLESLYTDGNPPDYIDDWHAYEKPMDDSYCFFS